MRKKNSSIFLSVFLAIFGEKYVSGLSKKLPFKCLKTHFSSDPLPGRCPGPNGGLRRPPYPRPIFFFGLDGPFKSIFQIHPWLQMIILIFFSIYWNFSQFYPKRRYFSQFQRPWPHSQNTQRRPWTPYCHFGSGYFMQLLSTTQGFVMTLAHSHNSKCKVYTQLKSVYGT